MDLRFRLGVLGAGRLGEAITKTWLVRTGHAPLLWSRSESHRATVTEANWVNEWTGILEAKSIVIAIPGRALLEMVEGNEQARRFTGNIFSGASSLSHTSLQRAFPRAKILRIAPFLIDGVRSIPMLVLRPFDLPLSEWLKAKTQLEDLGDIDVVENEEVFSQLALLGSSWPAVVLVAVEAAANAGVKGIPDETAIRIGKRLYTRAIQSLIAKRAGEQCSADDIATPGGITERGINSLGDVTSLWEFVFTQMQTRAEELKA